MKKIAFVVIVAILLLAIINLMFSIWGVWQKKNVILREQEELQAQKQENQRLKSALSYSQTSAFLEKEARDKLFMTKQGEQRILIQKDKKESEESGKKNNDPNWKKWLSLFF